MKNKRILLWFFALIVALIVLVGCGDYYVNVDKDAVKIEADMEGLIDGND